jgi:hypothetical protein
LNAVSISKAWVCGNVSSCDDFERSFPWRAMHAVSLGQVEHIAHALAERTELDQVAIEQILISDG